MSKRHFFLYDFLIPIAILLALGKFLAAQFDAFVFNGIGQIKAFGLGEWFSQSHLRQTLWDNSWLVFAAVPALLWLVWMRINVEYDYLNNRRRLDRPLYGFLRGLLRWVDGDESAVGEIRILEMRVVQAEDRARQAEAQLSQARQEKDAWESDYRHLESEIQEEREQAAFHPNPG